MSDLAPIVSRIPVPSRSLWWLAGAGAVGIVVPTMIGTATALAAYYPIGSFLPPTFLFSFLGTLFVVTLGAVLGVAVGIVYSLAPLSWRPFILSIILFGAIILGVYPGIATHLYLRKVAFELLAGRSMSLMEAIRKYERDVGSSPAALVDLVPHYLSDVPGTEMSRYPRYEYARESGMCPEDNSWNITVLAGDGLIFDMFFYCPRENYPIDVGGNWLEPVGDWAYMHE